MKILLVEDDTQLSELLQRVLSEEGHTLDVCDTLQQADAALRSEAHFDLIVLDRMLPDGDGLELCRRLQRRTPPVPTLMLTARGELQDRVEGLRTGADDYLTKPFEIEELLARVDAVSRRARSSWTTSLGAVEIDRRAQTVKANGTRLDLTTREYALIARLADDLNECVSRGTLLLDVWGVGFDPGSGLIDVHVSRLRDKLGPYSWMVETIRGQGFRLRKTR